MNIYATLAILYFKKCFRKGPKPTITPTLRCRTHETVENPHVTVTESENVIDPLGGEIVSFQMLRTNINYKHRR